MKKIILLLICLFVCIKANAAQLQFAAVSDANYSVKEGSATAQIMDWAIRSINLKKPKFVIFLGNNIQKSNEDNLKGFLKNAKSIKAPYYIVTGNQDAHKLSGLEKAEYWKIVRKYSKHNKSKNTYYTFSPNSDILCVVLDGGVPFSQSLHGIYPDEQIVWLNNILKKNKHKAIIIFQHFPLVEPVENKRLTTLHKEKYEEILKQHKNVILVSSGHYGVGKTTVDENGIYHISTPALNKADYNYDIITVNYQKVPLLRVKVKSINVEKVDLQ